MPCAPDVPDRARLAPGRHRARRGVRAGAGCRDLARRLAAGRRQRLVAAPTAARPDPAVIVHGTFGDQKSLLDNLSLALKRDGFCVYALDYGNRGTGADRGLRRSS